MRNTLALYQRRFRAEADDIVLLARWLYLDDLADQGMRRIDCERASDIHLIGRDLMYALCHAEYLVFMGQGRLPQELQRKMGMLRVMTRSGAPNSGSPDVHTVGFTAGREGYREAVEHIYKLFDLPLDGKALDFSSTTPPAHSPALGKRPETIDGYVDELWTTCIDNSESTFTAMYMFTTVWFVEVGNTNGFHIFPLRCRNRYGDWISEQIVWRQAWYMGIIAQLVSVSPVFYAAFVIGYLQ